MNISRNDTAGPALRGFRLQVLYTLARLTEPQTTLQARLWPEGIEDLTILDDQGAVREAIQIKGYTAQLRLSDLISKNGKGLLPRAVSTVREHPGCRIRLLSFGPFGEEIESAWNGLSAAQDRVAQKLRKAGLNPSDISLLFERLSLERVDEDVEQARVERFLGSVAALAGQPTHAAAILCYWLYGVAERREQVTQADLIARLSHVGRYLHVRDGYWRDWFSVIEPLEPGMDLELLRDHLSTQFQQGMSARYEHILAGCDIPRRDWLNKISDGFKNASTVIVHGASGQGKSALAYRWLQDETPDLWRLEVKLVDTRRDALQIAATLSGHAQAVGAPLTIYIDVRPGEVAWTDLVQELARLPQIRVLVSIREEDWRRAMLSGAAVAFEEVELTLEESEARDIYQILDSPDKPSRFLSFEDAWRGFVGSAGTDGPLMEFVYLATRTETLRERLNQQIGAIREASFDSPIAGAKRDVLAVVSFASALGARIDVPSLRRNSAGYDLGYIVNQLEQEYLVRSLDQGLRLDGLHPVRSHLLVEILCDGISFDRLDLAKQCLELIVVEDMEVFLLHIATRYPDLMPALVSHLHEWQPSTWAGIGGVLRALLWWGVKEYVDSLSGLVIDIMNDRGRVWSITLDLDIADLASPSSTPIWQRVALFSEEQKAQMKLFFDRQPPKALALGPAREFLGLRTKQPVGPETLGDWSAIAELSYWAGRWSTKAQVVDWLRAIELDSALDQLPLRDVSNLLRGRWELEGEETWHWLTEQHERIAARFRKETDTVWIEDRAGVIRAHFLVSWRTIATGGQSNFDENTNCKGDLNAEAIQRVELLRGLFPDRTGYGCQGHGHKVLPLPHDDTTKTSIAPEHLPPVWATRVNGFVGNLIEWQFRPAEWDEYLSQIWSLREDITAFMLDLRRALVSHFRDKQKRRTLGKYLDLKAWDALKSRLGKESLLPRRAVDEWGFVGEGHDKDRQVSASKIEQGFALSRYEPYLKSQSNLSQGLNNLLFQAVPHLFLDCADGKNGLDLSRNLIEATVKKSGGKVHSTNLVSSNLADAVSALPSFQKEFHRLFAQRFPKDQLDKQDRQERKLFDAVLPLMNAYLVDPTIHWKEEPERRAIARMWSAVNQIPKRISSALAPLASEGIRTRVLAKPGSWEDAPALWITLDCEDPLHVLTACTLIKSSLHQAIADASLSTEQTRALARRWKKIVLVPLFRGRALNRQAWLVPIYRLTQQDFSTEFEWIDNVLQAVSENDWNRTGLKCWNSTALVDTQEFLMVIGRFKILTHHLSGVLALVQADDADGEVLQSYLERHRIEWSSIIQRLRNGIAAIANKFSELEHGEEVQRPFLAEAAATVRDHHQSWLPPGLEDGNAVLSVDACASWLDMATQNLEALDFVGGALLLDAMVQAESLSVTE